MASDSTSGRSHLIEGRASFDVYYEDTDLSGFVYHANYLKFFERAREQLIGIEFLRDLRETGIHFVVSRAEIDYLAPARHGDKIEVWSKVEVSQSPVSNYLQEARVQGILVCRGAIRIGCLGLDNRPKRMPQEVLTRFLGART